MIVPIGRSIRCETWQPVPRTKPRKRILRRKKRVVSDDDEDDEEE